MASDAVDQYAGLNPDLSAKTPCRIATTGNVNLATGGLLTIDTVTLLDGDRVLVKNQSDTTQNGIYAAATGIWTRSIDADDNADFVTGTQVRVAEGAVGPGVYAVTTTDSPIIIGTSHVTFVVDPGSTVATTQAQIAAASAVVGLGDTDEFSVLVAGVTLMVATWLLIKTSLAATFVAISSLATAAGYRAATAGAVLTADIVWSALALVGLSDAATVTPNLSLGIDFSWTIGGNRTLGNPTNPKVGQKGRIIITQDGTGSRTITWDTSYKTVNGIKPLLSTAGNAVDVLYYDVLSSTSILVSLVRNVS